MTTGTATMNDEPMPADPTTQLPPPPHHVPRWHVPVARDTDENKLGGVVSGLCKAFGFDRRTTRFAAVVAALALPGVTALYIAAWILLPKPPEPARSLHQIVTERRRRPLLIAIALVAIFSGFGSWAFFGGLGWGVTLLGLGVVLWLSPNFGSGWRTAPAGAAAAGPAPYVTATMPATSSAPGVPLADWPAPMATPVPPAVPAPARRRRHPIQALSLAAAFVTAMVMSLGNAIDWWNASVYGTIVTVLAILVAGTVIGAVVNRSWFGVPMLMMLLFTGTGLLITHPNLNGGFGDRELRPTTVAEAEQIRHLGAGRLRLDLTSLPQERTVAVHAEVGYGQIRIIVPAGAELQLNTRVGAGHVVLDGEELTAGVRHEDDRVVPAATSAEKTRTIVLDLEIGGGEINITRNG